MKYYGRVVNKFADEITLNKYKICLVKDPDILIASRTVDSLMSYEVKLDLHKDTAKCYWLLHNLSLNYVNACQTISSIDQQWTTLLHAHKGKWLYLSLIQYVNRPIEIAQK
jgi:hypothetical protein